MKTFRIMALIAVVLCLPLGAQAQKLTEEERTELQYRVKQKLADFQMYLSRIASRDVSDGHKDAAEANALELFIGKGKAYDYTEIDIQTGQESTKRHAPVTMQTAGKRSGKRPPVPMVDYLKSLRNYTKWSKVVIESADVVRVEVGMREVSPGRYEGVAYFYQNYYAYSDNHVAYEDHTVKKVKIYIEMETIPMPEGSKHIWKVLLGDISVVSVSNTK